MRTKLRDLLTGIAATIALLAVVVGVPVALALTIGWPLPRSVPSVDAVAAALRYGQVPSSTVLRAVAVVLWLTWGAVIVSIAAEVVAVARGTIARGLPGMAGLQAVATRLVAAVLLLLPMASRATASPAPPPAPVVMAAIGGAAGSTAPHHTEPRRGDDPPLWTVRPRESLWTIAEQALGDGRRWREIVALNTDRVQPDGGRLRPADTLIHPGWRLELPTDARVDHRATVRVERGDDLWELAERHLGDGDRWRELYEENRGRPQRGGDRLTDPDLIRPGWVLRLPGADRGGMADSEAEAAARAAGGSDGSTMDVPAVRGGPRRRGDIERTDVEDGGAPSMEGAAPGGGDGAQPAAADGGGSRRPAPGAARPDDPHPAEAARPDDDPPRQAAEAADGAGHAPAPRRPTGAPVPARPVTPSTLRSVSGRGTDGDDPALTAATTRPHPPTPTVGALAIGGAAVLAAGLVALIAQRRRHWLRRRSHAGRPGRVDPEAAELERWLRSMADHDLAQRIDHVARTVTDLVSDLDDVPAITALELGDTATLYLRHATTPPPSAVTALDGGRRWELAPEREMAMPDAERRHFAALVSCGRTADDALVLANLCDGPAVGLDGSAAQVTEALTSWTAELAATGADAGVELVVAGAHDPLLERLARVAFVDDARGAVERARRTLDDGDGCVVVLAGAGDAPDEVAELRAIADDPRVGVVLPSAATQRRLLFDGDHLRLEPEGVHLVTPRWLTPADWDRFGDLLRQPAPSYAPELLPSPLATPSGPTSWTPPVEGDDDRAVVTVGVLGRITIGDEPVGLDPDASELLTWLAIHRTGGDPGVIQARLWPTSAPDGSRFRAACDTVADVLGGIVDDPIVHTDDGRVELTDAVGTDLARFDALVRRLDAAPAADQARRMSEALALVRSEPFGDGAAWAHADGLALATAAQVTEVAHRLAMHALAVLDVDRALWAVDRGLLAVPGCELLYRDRMRIADACGDATGVEAAMTELIERLDGAWPAAETTRLHAQLRGGGALRDATDGLPDAS